MATTTRDLLMDLNRVIWNEGQLHRIGEFVHPDFVADYRPYGPVRRGIEAVREMVERSHATFEGFREELHDVIVDGERAVVHFTIRGRHVGEWGGLPPSGKQLCFEEIVIMHLRDGKVVYQRGITDTMRALRQMGSETPEPDPPEPRTHPDVAAYQARSVPLAGD